MTRLASLCFVSAAALNACSNPNATLDRSGSELVPSAKHAGSGSGSDVVVSGGNGTAVNDWAGQASARGLSVGMFLGDIRASKSARLDEVERNINRHLDMLLTYHDIQTSPDYVGLSELIVMLDRRQTTLCLALQPSSGATGPKMRDIANGDEDLVTKRWGEAIALAERMLRRPVTVWLRYASEMNGNWDRYDRGADPVANSPAYFVQAWKRTHNLINDAIVQAGGKSRVRWVFTAAAHPLSGGQNAWALSDFWPGRDYVDVIALDGYNQVGNGWRPFAGADGEDGSVFEDGYNVAAQLDETLPMMIGETGSDRSDAAWRRGRGDRANWIRNAALQLKTRLTRIAALNYFNENPPGSTTTYGLSDDDGSIEAFGEAFAGGAGPGPVVDPSPDPSPTPTTPDPSPNPDPTSTPMPAPTMTCDAPAFAYEDDCVTTDWQAINHSACEQDVDCNGSFQNTGVVCDATRGGKGSHRGVCRFGCRSNDDCGDSLACNYAGAGGVDTKPGQCADNGIASGQ